MDFYLTCLKLSYFIKTWVFSYIFLVCMVAFFFVYLSGARRKKDILVKIYLYQLEFILIIFFRFLYNVL